MTMLHMRNLCIKLIFRDKTLTKQTRMRTDLEIQGIEDTI